MEAASNFGEVLPRLNGVRGMVGKLSGCDVYIWPQAAVDTGSKGKMTGRAHERLTQARDHGLYRYGMEMEPGCRDDHLRACRTGPGFETSCLERAGGDAGVCAGDGRSIQGKVRIRWLLIVFAKSGIIQYLASSQNSSWFYLLEFSVEEIKELSYDLNVYCMRARWEGTSLLADSRERDTLSRGSFVPIRL